MEDQGYGRGPGPFGGQFPGHLPNMMNLSMPGMGMGSQNWVQRLQAAGSRGQVGAILTTVDVGPNLDAVRVQSSLWVRRPQGDWVVKAVASREVKAASVPDAEAQQLAGGQMQFAFTTMQFTGFGNPNGFQRTVQSHPKLPAAQQKAMREVRADLLSRLKQRAISSR